MKSSFYNICFSHRDKNYIYNTLTTTLISVDNQVLNAIKGDNLSTLSADILSRLESQKIIVEDELDELAVYENYYNTSQYGATSEELRIVFIPTYNCNLKCTYCFEDCSLHSTITEENVEEVFEFIANQLSLNHSYHRISLVLFGGEPLLCTRECVSMCDKIREYCNSNSLDFESKIITNGILIDTEIIDTLILPNQMRIQITMDGVKDVHNSRRVHRNGKGTYDEILKAIDILNKFKLNGSIDLRINVDKNNISTIEGVLKDVYDKVDYIYIGLLRAEGSNKERLSDCISDNDYVLKYRPALESIFNKYGKKLHYSSFGKKHSCALNSGNSFIVDCNLDVYKCDNLVGRPAFSVGKIRNGELIKNSQYYSQRTWSPLHFESCRKCNKLPACTSSCAYLCLSKNGSISKPLCAMTDNQLIEKIRQYIDNR